MKLLGIILAIGCVIAMLCIIAASFWMDEG